MNTGIRTGAVVFIVMMFLTAAGLAVPNINLTTQEIGSGRGDLFSPVSSGEVCVPYEYYVVIYVWGSYWGDTTVPLTNVPQVYPGNFDADVSANANVSVAVYDNSGLISQGTTVLAQTLPAGYYTAVNISPAITGDQALTSEFRTVLQPPNYTSSNNGSISLLLQELGLGIPTGAYRDIRVYLGSYDYGIVTYYVYLDLRCYSQSFVPAAVSTLASIPTAYALLDDALDRLPFSEEGTDKTETGIEVLESGKRKHCPALLRLRFLLLQSDYVRKMLPEVLEKLNKNLESKIGESS